MRTKVLIFEIFCQGPFEFEAHICSFYAPGADICELSPLVVSRSIFKLENFLFVLEVPYKGSVYSLNFSLVLVGPTAL